MGLITTTFTYTGATVNFTVPQLVGQITIKAWGAGASEFGGPGGYATGDISVVEGDILDIVVGQGGVPTSNVPTFGGGGPAGVNSAEAYIEGSSGGGASIVIKNTSELLLVAGGGGGGGSSSPSFNLGGSGGGTTGTTGWVNNSGTTAGEGGSQVAGGAGGIAPITLGNGTAGMPFLGGTGGSCVDAMQGTGGGGGGGYFGGGGGAAQRDYDTQESCGGGGSSFLSNLLTNASTQSTPQNTSTSPSSPGLLPPNRTDPAYITGVGIGDPRSVFSGPQPGGNGLVVLQYTEADLINTKTVSEAYAAAGVTLTYTVNIFSTGSATLPNVTFVDTIPNGTTFIPGSLTIGGVSSPNNPNPPGFTIPEFPSGVTVPIAYQVRVDSIPSPNPITNTATSSYPGGHVFNSNTVTTRINSVLLSSSKIVNTIVAIIGDILTYTIPIMNTGNVTATNILFIDSIPNGTTLVANSLKQDGAIILGSPNPPGVTLPNSIGINRISTVTFQVAITQAPNPNPIPNTATVISNFIIDNTTIPNKTGVAITTTNTVTTSATFASVELTKYVDKTYATCGNIINYTIVATNSGTVTASNIIFVDTIPNGTSLVSNSVIVDGVPQIIANLNTGITIPDIVPGATSTIAFSVQVQC